MLCFIEFKVGFCVRRFFILVLYWLGGISLEGLLRWAGLRV